MVREAFIYDAVRTPRGRGKKDGSLHEVKPVDLLSPLLKSLVERNDFNSSDVNDIVIGCVTPVGEQGANIARTAVARAGWDWGVPGLQINRFCSSGLDAVNLAAMHIQSEWNDLLVAGGVESMSRIPMGSDGGGYLSPDISNELGFVPQGISADLIATIEGIGRKELDKFAVRSQKLAHEASINGHFKKSLIPIHDQNGMLILDKDEFIRPETTEKILSTLKPSFSVIGDMGFDAVAQIKYPEVESINHVHTPGNASGIVDGSGVILLGSKEIGEKLGLKPRARIVTGAVVGTEPTIMLTGPAPATKKALSQAGMSIHDIDLIEINEAFAVVVLKYMRDMGIENMEKINVNGGSIALGHPLGATGAILLGTVLDELERRDQNTGLVSLCIGAGMGIATIIERV